MTDEQLYDVWFVETENVSYPSGDKLIESCVSKESAQETIYFAHVDEPSPDRCDYWNYVMVPSGTKPEKYQRR